MRSTPGFCPDYQNTPALAILSNIPEEPSVFNPDLISPAFALAPVPALSGIDGGTFGSGPDTLVLTLAEDAFQGDAQASAAIDGQTLTAPITVTALKNAGHSEVFTFKGTFGAGAHDLAVSFLNDAYGGTPTADRNLYVTGANYNGISTRPLAAELDTAGTARFTIPPANDPETGVGPVAAAFSTVEMMHSFIPPLTGN